MPAVFHADAWLQLKLGTEAFQKRHSPIRYYYLVFDIYTLLQVVDNEQCVMTKERLDKQLVGQRATPLFHSKHTTKKKLYHILDN